MKKLKTKVNFKDKRGKITDLVENENINGISVITFSKGAVRGNHFHKKTKQYNYILRGKIKFVSQNENEKIKSLLARSGDLILTLPLEKHALMALEDSELMVFTVGPRTGKNYESDTFRLLKPLLR